MQIPIRLNCSNYDNLSQKDREKMKVDEIFALYLFRISGKVNSCYYKKTALPFIILFRECLNEYGWSKKYNVSDMKEELERDPVMRHDIANKEFCLNNNAEHAPEICNEFVTVYMEQRIQQWNYIKHNMSYNAAEIVIPEINKSEQIDLTINFCHWLFECQFTCSKLSLIA